MDDVYAQIVERIIKSQEAIIGPVAVEQALLVHNLNVDWGDTHKISIEGNSAQVVEDLVKQYRNLFGQISVEVSKEAVGSLASQLPPNGLPSVLK
jgi:hypothetical protein